MTEDELRKGKELMAADFRDAVRMFAGPLGVDANELLRKMPSFPVNPTEPGQLQAFLADFSFKAETGELSVTEVEVCHQAFGICLEIVQEALKKRGTPTYRNSDGSPEAESIGTFYRSEK